MKNGWRTGGRIRGQPLRLKESNSVVRETVVTKDLWVLTVSLSFPTALTQTTYGATKLGMLKRPGAWEMVSLKRLENHSFFSSLAGFCSMQLLVFSLTHTISSDRFWWRFSSLIGSFPSAAHSWADHLLLDELHCQSYHEPLKSSRCVTAPNAVDLGVLRCMVHDHAHMWWECCKADPSRHISRGRKSSSEEAARQN